MPTVSPEPPPRPLSIPPHGTGQDQIRLEVEPRTDPAPPNSASL
jgi:hypothetical protein